MRLGKKVLESLQSIPEQKRPHALMEYLAGYLRKPRVERWLWNRLSAYVRDAAVEPCRETIENLCYRASYELHVKRLRKKRSSKQESSTSEAQPVDVNACIDPREIKRSEVLAKELARRALAIDSIHMHPDTKEPVRIRQIERFRSEYLSDEVLDDDRALKFVTSPALALLSLGTLRKKGVSILEHEADVKSREPYYDETYRTMKEKITVEVRHGDRCLEIPTEDPSPDNPLLLAFSRPSRGKQYTGFVKYSVLADLHQLAEKLSRLHRWDLGATVHFILTGTPPPKPCVLASAGSMISTQHSEAWIEMSIVSWTSPETVARVYRHLQSEQLAKRNRMLTVHRLELMDFVAERRHQGIPWRQIRKEWDKRHPKHKYGLKGFGNFQRAFAETYASVMSPRLRSFTKKGV